MDNESEDSNFLATFSLTNSASLSEYLSRTSDTDNLSVDSPRVIEGNANDFEESIFELLREFSSENAVDEEICPVNFS